MSPDVISPRRFRQLPRREVVLQAQLIGCAACLRSVTLNRLRCDLKHRAVNVLAPEFRCAVEIPLRVENQSSAGIIPICSRILSKTVENCLRPGGRQFKDGAEVVSAASRGRAVEIALRVEDQASQWSGPVLPFTKAVENRFLARWRELKNRTFVVGAAQLGGAVEVTLRVEDQTCGSEVSVRRILIKTMENRLRP